MILLRTLNKQRRIRYEEKCYKIWMYYVLSWKEGSQW